MRTNRRTLIFATAAAAAATTVRALPTNAQDDAAKLVVFGDVIQGGQNVPEDQKALRSCVLSSRFPRNSQIVWRMRVVDPKTGEQMDSKALTKVEVMLSDDQVFEMEYGPHPPAPNPPRDSYWTAPWLVPMDYPTGTLGYSVVATAADGRTGEYKPFDVPSSLPTITDDVYETVKEED